MWPSGLRKRLVLVFLLTAGTSLVAAGFGAWLLVERMVWGPLDAALWEEADTIRGELGEGGGAGPVGEGLHRVASELAAERDLGSGKFVLVRSSGGVPLAAAGEVPDGLPVLEGLPSDEPSSFLLQRDPSLRVLAARFGDTEVMLGVSVEPHLLALRRVAGGLVVAGLLILSALGVIVWVLTGRATDELESLARELEAIGVGSLDRRLATRHVTEVDRLVSELNRLLARLERAVVHLKRFTSDASHELRTPIAALRVEIETALARERSPDEYRASLLDALEQTDRLTQLASGLLYLSETEAGVLPEGALAPVDVSEVVQRVAASLEPLLGGRKVELELEGAARVVGSTILLERLLVNLLDNAITHGGSDVPVGVSVRRAEGRVSIRVWDRGEGMPERDVERAFERLFRGTSARGSGAGLGLAMCREIADRHGGRIDIRSAPGEGTDVTVDLPGTET